MPSLKQIRYFLTIADQGSFTQVLAGFGIAVVPEGMTVKVPAGVVYRPLSDENGFAKSALVLPRHPTPLTQCFVRITGAA